MVKTELGVHEDPEPGGRAWGMHLACGEEPETRQELGMEVLARGATRRVYPALYGVTLSHLNSEDLNTEWSGMKERERSGDKQVVFALRGQPLKSVSDGSVQNPGTSRGRHGR